VTIGDRSRGWQIDGTSRGRAINFSSMRLSYNASRTVEDGIAAASDFLGIFRRFSANSPPITLDLREDKSLINAINRKFPLMIDNSNGTRS